MATSTTGAPRRFRAKGWTSPVSHLWSAATISQVRVAGGEKVIFGLESMLTRCMGAGAPQALPSRIGGVGSATRSRPLRRAAQRARPSAISLADHSADHSGASCADGSLGGLGFSTVGQVPSGWAATDGLPAKPGDTGCCAEATEARTDMAATDMVAKAYAIAAWRVIGIRNTYP